MKKLKSFNFLTTEKVKNKYKCRCRDKVRTIKTWTDEYGHNVRKTVKKLRLDFWKSKIKKNEYISLFSIRDKDKTASHPRERFILLDRTKKEKAVFEQTKHFAKKWSKNCSDCIYENFNFFKTLTPKNSNFYCKEIKTTHTAQKDYFNLFKSKYKQKFEKNLKITTKIGLAYEQFYKKNHITSKKNGPLRRKQRLKTVIFMSHSVKNYFSTSDSHSLNDAHDQKTSLAQKKLVHTAIFLTFAFRSKHRLNE